MAFDERKYLKYFAKSNLTEEEKLERIRTFKGILQPFMDAAFGQHPVQLCRDTPKQKYLQSPNQGVESKKVSGKFKKQLQGPLTKKPRIEAGKIESANHVKLS